MKKIGIIILIIIVAVTSVYLSFFYENYPTNYFAQDTTVEIPNSSYHENGTWWGYNQSKLTKVDDVIFSYYIDNSTQVNGVANLNNPNYAVVFMIKNGVLTEFDELPTSRPVNVLGDDVRNLIYYVCLEPTMTTDNGSTGKLVVYHYFYDGVNVFFIQKETVVEHDGVELETVNIRVGACIDAQGNLAVAYGLADATYTFSMVVQQYNVIDESWSELSYYMEGVQEPNFYPDIAMHNLNDFYILAIQDVCIGGPCRYKYLRYFHYDTGVWDVDYMVDYREEVTSENILVEHMEAYYDEQGLYHSIYRSMVGKDKYYHTTLNSSGVLTTRQLTVHRDINWIRLVELNGVRYFVAYGNGRTQILDYDTQAVLYNDTNALEGCYLYVYSNQATAIDIIYFYGKDDDYASQNGMYKRIVPLTA